MTLESYRLKPTPYYNSRFIIYDRRGFIRLVTARKSVLTPSQKLPIKSTFEHIILVRSFQTIQMIANDSETFWPVVVAQLVEWSLPIPEARSSNPVIGKNLY